MNPGTSSSVWNSFSNSMEAIMSQRDDNDLNSASISLGPATTNVRRINGQSADAPFIRETLSPKALAEYKQKVFEQKLELDKLMHRGPVGRDAMQGGRRRR
jgi:hypothetical protein